MSWDSSFELYPAPGDQGAVTNNALRELKGLVKEYVEKQHVFDEESSPECIHVAGMGTVVNIAETPIALNVVGGLAYSTDSDILYRDRGGGLGFETIGGTDHGSLLNLSDDSAHSQYLLLSGGTITDVTIDAGYKITGLNTTELGYTTGDVMPYTLHIGEDVSGGAKHSDDVIIDLSTDVDLTCVDKIKSSIVESGPTSVAAGSTIEWLIGRMAFVPLASFDMTMFAVVYPLFNVSPPDDWVAGFTFRNGDSTAKVFHMTAAVIDA